MKKNIIEIIKKVKRIMVNLQIRDLRDIKLKDYMIRKNIDKLFCKLNYMYGNYMYENYKYGILVRKSLFVFVWVRKTLTLIIKYL